MGIGEARDRKGDLFGLNWPAHPIKCLGVYLTYDYEENTANWWKGKGLTLIGRAQIINSLLLPKLIYIASMFVVAEEIIKEINKIVFKFLWRGQDRVMRTAIINSYENALVFLLSCDYDPKDIDISNTFYKELIKFRADFRQVFSDAKRSSSIIWNKNIRIDGKPVFYKTFLDKNIIQLGLSKSTLESLDIIKKEMNIKCNFIQWAGLRAAISSILREGR